MIASHLTSNGVNGVRGLEFHLRRLHGAGNTFFLVKACTWVGVTSCTHML